MILYIPQMIGPDKEWHPMCGASNDPKEAIENADISVKIYYPSAEWLDDWRLSEIDNCPHRTLYINEQAPKVDCRIYNSTSH